jgi:hypothetical protein
MGCWVFCDGVNIFFSFFLFDASRLFCDDVKGIFKHALFVSVTDDVSTDLCGRGADDAYVFIAFSLQILVAFSHHTPPATSTQSTISCDRDDYVL